MTFRRLVARAIEVLIAWRFDHKRPDRQRRLYSAIPVLRELDQRQGNLARQHRPGVRAIERQKRQIMTERLAFECRRAN